jgi:hypothetical protein
MLPETPLRNEGETMACALCGTAFQPVGRQRFCTPAHRQAAGGVDIRLRFRPYQRTDRD